jgi:hypothetical protein
MFKNNVSNISLLAYYLLFLFILCTSKKLHQLKDI